MLSSDVQSYSEQCDAHVSFAVRRQDAFLLLTVKVPPPIAAGWFQGCHLLASPSSIGIAAVGPKAACLLLHGCLRVQEARACREIEQERHELLLLVNETRARSRKNMLQAATLLENMHIIIRVP